jgi:hypothetical protein
VEGLVIGVVEDLVDLGGTATFVASYLADERKARKIVLIAPFLKTTDVMNEMEVIYYGHVPKDTWIITPRERVETLVKRVPFWRNNGATLTVCEANLRKSAIPAICSIFISAPLMSGDDTERLVCPKRSVSGYNNPSLNYQQL